MKHILACILLCVPAVVSAADRGACVQVEAVTVQQQQCLPLLCPKPQLVRGYGSGTIVGQWRGQWAVLTCYHVVRDARSAAVILDGNRYECEVIAGEKSTDLAVLAFAFAGDLPHIGIASGARPNIGTDTVACGYPGGRGYLELPGRILGYTSHSLVFSPNVEQGTSGGGLLIAGELAGVIWGADGRAGHATPAETIRAFLTRRNVQIETPERYVRQPQEAPITTPISEPNDTEPREQPPTEPQEQIPSTTQPKHEATAGIPWGLIIQYAATAAGVGTPVGLGIAAAGWLFGRIRERKRYPIAKPVPERPPVAVPVDSPPPPQQVQTEVRFAPYAIDRYSQAHAWASEQMSRKYPGCVDCLNAEREMLKQWLSANPE